MKNYLLLLLALCLSLEAQDLKTSVEEVLSTNPIIQERLQNFKASKTDIDIANAGYYPTLDLKLGAGIENFDKDKPSNWNPKTLDVYEGSIIYSQNLFKGFNTSNQVDAQEKKSVSAAYSYIEKANDTSFKMVDSYLQVIKNIELIKTAKNNVQIHESILFKVEKLYEKGLTTLSEVSKIKSSLSLAKTNLMVQENTLRDTQYNLQKVLGRKLEIESMSKPMLSTALPNTLKEAIDTAKKNNPSLLVSTYNIKLAKAEKSANKSSYYPSLDLELSARTNSNENGIDDNKENTLKGMLYLSYNIFNGLSDDAKLERSIISIQQEIQKKLTLEREVVEGMKLSWVAYSTLQTQLDELEEYEKFSKKTLDLYKKEYELGRRSLLDLLSAQSDYIGAQSKIISTEYSFLFSKYRILDSMGALIPAVIGDDAEIKEKVDLK